MTVQWLINVLNEFEQADRLTQIGLVSGLIPLAGGAFIYLRQRYRRGLSDLENEVEKLKRLILTREAELSELRREKGELEETIASLEGRLPNSVLLRAKEELRNGNEECAVDLQRRLIEDSGSDLAHAALAVSRFHLAMYTGVDTDVNLIAGERFAMLAACLDPNNLEGRKLVAEWRALAGNRAASVGDFALAVRNWD